MATGHHELEGAGCGLAEERDRLVVAPAAGVVLQLPVVTFVPTGVDDSLEDRAHECPLVGAVEVGVERRPSDLPVGGDAGAKQSALGIHVVPREGDLVPLAGRERAVEL